MVGTVLNEQADVRPGTNPRYIYNLTAIVHVDGERTGAVLVNLSCDGLRLACSAELGVGRAIWVEVAGWPYMAATVIWQKGGMIGCSLHTEISATSMANRLRRAKGIDRLDDEIYI